MQTNEHGNDNRYYRTSNFSLAAFLFSKNIVLVNIDKITNPKRAHFVFLSSPVVEELVSEFDYAPEDHEEVMVDARKLIYATKTLKEKLYQDK